MNDIQRVCSYKFDNVFSDILSFVNQKILLIVGWEQGVYVESREPLTNIVGESVLSYINVPNDQSRNTTKSVSNLHDYRLRLWG